MGSKPVVTDVNISLQAMISAGKENNWMRREAITGEPNLNGKVRADFFKKTPFLLRSKR